MVPRIVLAALFTIGPVSAPGPRVLQFHVEIYVRREIVAETQPRQLLRVEVVLFAMSAVRCGAAVRAVTGSVTDDSAAETDVVPHDRPHAEIGSYPELLEIEIPSDLRIVEFILFLLRNRARNDWGMGDSFTLRHFKRGLCLDCHE